MKKLVNLRTALFVAFSLCVGILFSYSIFCNAIVYTFFIGIIFFSLVGVYLIFNIKDGKMLNGIILSSIFIFVAIVGGISFSVRIKNYQSASLGNHYETITGKVVERVNGENYQSLVLDNLCISSDSVNSRYKLSLYVYGESNFDIGDIICVNSVLIDKNIYYNGRFSASTIEEGIKYSAQCEDKECFLLRNEKTIFEKVNIFIRETCKNGLGEKEFPVVYALLTGNSNYMDNELLTNFRASGVAHIFAVSGLHIGFLATVLAFIFNKLRIKKIISFFVMTFCLFFYSGVCGFSASSIRASIMCSCAVLATLFGQRADGISSMGIALFIVLIISPMQIFLVGFQLSFGVTFAILVLSNPLMKLLKFLPYKVAYALATVFSAQIASIPIMIIHFGAFSLCSVIVNLLMIPIVSVVFIFSLVSVLISGIFLLQQILLPLNYIIKAIIYIIEIIDFTVFVVGGISLCISVLFYYLALYVFGGMVNLKRFAKGLVISILIVSFVGVQLGADIYEHNAFKVFSVTDKNLYVSIVKYQKESVMVVSKADGNMNISALKTMCNVNHIKGVKDVVLLESKERIDVQRFATCVSLVLNMEKIFYYGQKDERLESMMQKSFPNINLYNYTESGLNKVNVENRVLIDGYGLELGYEDKKATFFSSIDEKQIDLEELSGEVQFMVGINHIENINSRIKAKDKYSYTVGGEVESIENYGNIKYYLR